MQELEFRQILPISKDECWDFFSSPANLNKITPPDMKFDILSNNVGKMYPGQIISYKVKILPFLKVNWVTEITQVIKGKYFIDEQRFGPYKFWHHQHHFKEVNGGMEIVDLLNYSVPLGVVGRLINYLFVEKKIRTIFEYRSNILSGMFQ